MITRRNSFFESRAVGTPHAINRVGNHLVDNEGLIIATKDFAAIPPTRLWLPMKLRERDGTPRAVICNNRVYWLHVVCDDIGTWSEWLDDFEWRSDIFVDIMAALYDEEWAWNLDYEFPCLGCPFSHGLECGNMEAFLMQFASDPFEPEVIDDSSTVGTFSLTTIPSVDEDIPLILDEFAWEYDMDYEYD